MCMLSAKQNLPDVDKIPGTKPGKVGFVGTGIMGRGMVRNLIKAGYAVQVYNRTRTKAEEAVEGKGAVVATPAEAAGGADVVFTMLADPEAVTACYEGAGGLLSGLSGSPIVIDSSTISKPATLRIARQVEARGGRFLDAPVTGSKNEADTGKLRFLVGGAAETLEAARPVLECLGTWIHMGSTGMGITAKLVNNLVVASSLQAFNEGMTLAVSAGLDPDTMYSLLMSNPRARIGMAELKGPTILKGDFTPHFLLRLMRKDVRLALETAEELGFTLPVAAATKGVFDACMDAGHGGEDFSAIIKHLETKAGVAVRSRS